MAETDSLTVLEAESEIWVWAGPRSCGPWSPSIATSPGHLCDLSSSYQKYQLLNVEPTPFQHDLLQILNKLCEKPISDRQGRPLQEGQKDVLLRPE